jgi:hypothetical protein
MAGNPEVKELKEHPEEFEHRLLGPTNHFTILNDLHWSENHPRPFLRCIEHSYEFAVRSLTRRKVVSEKST